MQGAQMTVPKRVTVLNPWVFGLISGGFIVVVALSVAKYFSKYSLHPRDPYYLFSAVWYVALWMLWFYIYVRGRKFLQRGNAPVAKR